MTPTSYQGTYEVSDATIPNLHDALPKIGNGMFRTAYDMGDVVVKRATKGTARERECNLGEAALWAKVKDTEVAPMFAAVLACASGGDWLVMEKAASTLWGIYGLDDWSSDKYKAANAHIRTFKEVYAGAIQEYKVGDMHGANIAMMTDGRTAMIDYALPLHWGS